MSQSLKELYRKSYYEKWQKTEDGTNRYLYFEPCPFCRSIGIDNTIGIRSSECSKQCGIDPILCGSPNSLLKQLSDVCDENGQETKVIIAKIIYEIKKRGVIE